VAVLGAISSFKNYFGLMMPSTWFSMILETGLTNALPSVIEEVLIRRIETDSSLPVG